MELNLSSKVKKVTRVKVSNLQQYLENKELIYCETNAFWLVTFIRVFIQHIAQNIWTKQDI